MFNTLVDRVDGRCVDFHFYMCKEGCPKGDVIGSAGGGASLFNNNEASRAAQPQNALRCCMTFETLLIVAYIVS